jgi:hypothetical protein
MKYEKEIANLQSKTLKIMEIKTMFDASSFEAIKTRLENFQPNAVRQWGKMDAAQMLAHCSISLEQCIGKTPFIDESNFIFRTLIKWVVLRQIRKGKLSRNSPTAKSFYVTDERQFDVEKQRLLNVLTEFFQKGQSGHLMPHPAFGPLTKDDWGQLMHLHLHHHLTQFNS